MPATSASISDLLSTIRALPPLPAGVGRLLALSPGDPSFFETACAIVRAEPALAAEVLKIANAAPFAGQTQVTSVDRAMKRVGARMIPTTLTETHLHRSFDTKDEMTGHLWLSNAFSANLVMTLAQARPEIAIEPEVAYADGLLHDVGRLVLAALYRNAAGEIIEENPHPVSELVRREEEVFGLSHTLAGRILGNQWQLPPRITAVATAHHVPRTDRGSYPQDLNRTIELMAILDLVVHRLNEGLPSDGSIAASVEEMLESPVCEPLLEIVGVRARDVVDAVQPALAAVERQQKLLGLESSTFG